MLGSLLSCRVVRGRWSRSDARSAVSCVVHGSADQPSAGLVEAGRDGAVDDLVADLRPGSRRGPRGRRSTLRCTSAAVDAAQRRGEPLLLLLGQRHGRGDGGDQAVCGGRRRAWPRLSTARSKVRPAGRRRRPAGPDARCPRSPGRRAGCVEQRAPGARPARRGRSARRAARRAPATIRPNRNSSSSTSSSAPASLRPRRRASTASCSSASTRSRGCDQRDRTSPDHEVDGGAADLLAEHARGPARPGRRRLRAGSVRARRSETSRSSSAVDREQLVAEGQQVGVAGTDQRAQRLASGRRGLAARAAACAGCAHASSSSRRSTERRRRRRRVASSSSRKRSTTRRCRASSSRDSPTMRPARSVASVPTSPTQLR